MTHLPYHGDANAAAQDLLGAYGAKGAAYVAEGMVQANHDGDFWHDVAALLRLESQDEEPRPSEPTDEERMHEAQLRGSRSVDEELERRRHRDQGEDE